MDVKVVRAVAAKRTIKQLDIVQKSKVPVSKKVRLTVHLSPREHKQ